MKRFSMWALSALLLASCATGEKPTASGLLKSNFQTEVDGKKPVGGIKIIDKFI